jgi:hypothetical protein
VPPVTPPALHTAVKKADRAAAYLEATRLAGFGTTEARHFFGTPPAGADAMTLEPWPAERAAESFLARFRALSAEREASPAPGSPATPSSRTPSGAP